VEPLPPYQHPAGFIVTDQPFTIEGGELTSNLKIRRKRVAEKYDHTIKKLYSLFEAAGKDKGHQATQPSQLKVISL
jgi:long-chain acyl-CoA synthetase